MQHADEAKLNLFLRQIYVSMGVIALLNGPIADSEMEKIVSVSKEGDQSHIDGFLGFARGLIPVFKEVRCLIDSDEPLTPDGDTFPEPEIDVSRGWSLIRKVELMLERVEDEPARFRPDIQHSIGQDAAAEYALLNKAYHHVALILIYRHALKTPAMLPAVQKSVESAIT
jgi:hypothetical protein